MRTRTKLALAALAATTLFATAFSTATARNLSTSNQNIRAAFRELRFFTSETTFMTCPVTIEGSFHARTTAKVLRSLVGFVTRVSLAEAACRGEGLLAGGRVRPDTETLPWHISYEGFRGALPSIERILLLLRLFFTVYNLPFIGECRYGGNAFESFLPSTNELEADRTVAIPRTGGSGGASCPASGNFQGRTRATLLGTSTPITITLI